MSDVSRGAVSANTADLLATASDDFTPTGTSAFSDTLDLLRPAFLLLQTAGAVTVTTHEGQKVTLDNLAVGFVAFPCLVRRVWDTDTDEALKSDGKLTLVYPRH